MNIILHLGYAPYSTYLLSIFEQTTIRIFSTAEILSFTIPADQHGPEQEIAALFSSASDQCLASLPPRTSDSRTKQDMHHGQSS